MTTVSRCRGSCRQAVQAVKSKAPIGQGRANMALGVVLGQLASMPGLPQKERADYHDEAMLALQQAVACDPADINILYNLALVQVSFCVRPASFLLFLFECVELSHANLALVQVRFCVTAVENRVLVFFSSVTVGACHPHLAIQSSKTNTRWVGDGQQQRASLHA